MPKSVKTFQFGRKRRHTKARGISLLRKQQVDQAEVVDEDSGHDITDQVPVPGSSSATDSSFVNSLNVTVTDSESPQPTAVTPSRIRTKLTSYNLLDTDEQLNGCVGHFLLVHTSFLSSMISSVVCPTCHSSALSLQHSTKHGLAVKLIVHCDDCHTDVFSDFTSPCGPKRYEVNSRLVLAAKENGIGFNKLASFMSLMNMPQPMHHSTFHDISEEIHKATREAAESVMNKAASILKDKFSTGALKSERHSSTGCPVTTISFDGTWQKRGHSSHNGVGVAIDAETGLVVDTETISNFCMACEKGPRPDSEEYVTWYDKHQESCQKNSDCSSNAMEMVAAQKIFGRSVDKRGLVYGYMVCDGDSKAFQCVNETAGYDIEIIKLDCVNHIAKRMFNSLENTKKCNKSDLNRKLTKPMIDKITNTYAKNLKDHAPDVEAMKNAVLGGILHMASTDEHPNHRHCPVSETSWCGYQRAIFKGESPPLHKPTFKPDILPFIWPVMKRLTEPELLERCARMLTQNANESFNVQIWRRCSKSTFASRVKTETAVALAVLAFNCGPSGLKYVMARLGIPWGKLSQEHAVVMVQDKISGAEKKTAGMSKWKRKHRKTQRLVQEHQRETSEGPTYQGGAFNM